MVIFAGISRKYRKLFWVGNQMNDSEQREAVAEVLRKQAQAMGRLSPTEAEIDDFMRFLRNPSIASTMQNLKEIEKVLNRVIDPPVKRFDRVNHSRRKGRGREKRV